VTLPPAKEEQVEKEIGKDQKGENEARPLKIAVNLAKKESNRGECRDEGELSIESVLEGDRSGRARR